MSERLAELCTITTCHGVADWYESKGKVPKLFWTAVLIGSFCAIGYYQYNLVLNYVNMPTATKITKTSVDYLAFPNVTVCNQNAYSMARLNATWPDLQQTFRANGMLTTTQPIELLEEIRWTTLTPPLTEVLSKPLQTAIMAKKEAQILFNNTFNPGVTNKYQLNTFLADIAYTCDDIFTLPEDCSFGIMPFNCCEIATTVHTQFGNCYVISPKRIDKSIAPYLAQVQPGMNSGLEMTMTYSTSDSPNYDPQGVRTEGFYLSIGDHMTSLDHTAVTVGPSMFVSINLALSRYEYDPTTAVCTDATVPLQYTNNGVTSVQLCNQECVVKMNFQFCGCSPVYPNTQIPYENICDSVRLKGCFFGNSQMFYNETYRKAVGICQDLECKKLCNTQVYTPFAVYSKVAPKHRTGDFHYQTSVANVFFGELAYTMIVEKPLVDLTGLISGFGGNLGLFAGMSLITIVQCLATFVCAGHDAFINWKKRKSGTVALVKVDEKPKLESTEFVPAE